MARWKVTVHFKLADSEPIERADHVVEEEGRRRVEEWQLSYARRTSSEPPPSLDFPTADGARQFFAPHTVRRIDMRPA